jgi:hypothetical protein
VSGLIGLTALAWAATKRPSAASASVVGLVPVAFLVLVGIGLVFGGVDGLAGLIAFLFLLPFAALNIVWLRSASG